MVAQRTATATKKCCVYYSVNGGAILGCLVDPNGDPQYERSLDRAGVNWGKAQVPASEYAPGAIRAGDRFDVGTQKVVRANG